MRILRIIARRPRTILLAALATTVVAAWLSSRLQLRTAFTQLLPNEDRGVVAWEHTQRRMGDMGLMLVGIRSPDAGANEAYARALVQHLDSLPRSVCELATYHIRDVTRFIEANRWMYASEADLSSALDRLRGKIARHKNPLLVDLSDPDEDEALEARSKGADWLGQRFPEGMFLSANRQTLWVIALPPGGVMVERAGETLLGTTHDFIARHPPRGFHPAMEVVPTGPVVTPVRNRLALQKDLTWVASLCGILIPLSMALYFRRARAVIFVAVPAALATLLAYAVASLIFGYLTLVTSFLVSFVMGNGTNYAVVLLAHYEQERREGRATPEAINLAISSVWRPTAIAALASAVSYLSLMVTSFRGFSQFGLIGAVGCLFAWAMTFTVMPASLLVFDRRWRAKATSKPPPRLILDRVAGIIARSPARVLAVGGAVTVLAIVGSAHFGRDAFEYDFRKLSSQGASDARARDFDRESSQLFGRWPHPIIVLADRPEDVGPLKSAIRRADAVTEGDDVIGQIFSIEDVLPGSVGAQERKLALLGQIRDALDDPALQAADPAQLDDIKRLRPPEGLRVLLPSDLPALVRRPFTETDGTIGRVLLVYPPEEGLSVWNGHDLLRIAKVLQRIALPDGRYIETSGTAVIFSTMLRSVLRDGPLATLASLAAVAALVLLRVRPWRFALLILAALATGVVWMAGIAGFLGVKITFLNFIALPFIIGVGVEYAIHVVSEYQEHHSIHRAIVSAGGPVALCSWSAIVGYGSLLSADNGALRGLGGIATLGELTCLVAAVVLIPAALTLRRSWR